MFKITLLVLSPVIGGLIQGFERKIRARMQNRIGPPLLQPFYDMFKLFKKEAVVVDWVHAILAVMHFLTLIVVVAMVIYEMNLLYIIFMHLFATIFLVTAGFSVRSIYSHLGANRELLVLIVYEPILIFTSVGLYLINDSFLISDILSNQTYLNLLFLPPLGLVALIKLSKSPFDNAHAHQEIIGGVEIEYSGFVYEFLYTAKWLEYFFIFALFWLLGADNIMLSTVLILFCFLFINLIDNASARVQMQALMKFGIIFGYGYCILILLGLLYV